MTTSVRLPMAVALAMRAEAERRNVPYSDVAADALAVRYELPSVLPPDDQAAGNEQMRLTA